MKQIVRDWVPLNERTRPLEGSPLHRSAGVICAVDAQGVRYSVGEIAYEQYGEENFQYILTPYWEIVDALPADIFQGIPGFDMDLRLEHYYRVNYVPVFITERTPGENREDLWELLDSVGLDYYDRFEWLLRTNLRSGSDNLIVERKKAQPSRYFVRPDASPESWRKIAAELQYGDVVHFSDLHSTGGLQGDILDVLFQLLSIGAVAVFEHEDREIGAKERGLLLSILLERRRQRRDFRRERQKMGIRRAQREGRYRGGRKKQEIAPETLNSVMGDYVKKRIPLSVAMQRLEIKSESTFFRRLRDYRSSL